MRQLNLENYFYKKRFNYFYKVSRYFNFKINIGRNRFNQNKIYVSQSTYKAPQGTSCKSEDVGGQRRRANNHQSQSTSHSLLHLSEHQFVPKTVRPQDSPVIRTKLISTYKISDKVTNRLISFSLLLIAML